MSVISLHGGGSPEAMKREIYRRYPVYERTQMVTKLIERGVLAAAPGTAKQPGQCCDEGCAPPDATQPITFVPRRVPGRD